MSPTEQPPAGRRLRVGFCVSGQGRLFGAAVEQRSAIGIVPAFLAAGQTATSEVMALAARAGVTAERLAGPDRAARDAAIAGLVDRTGAELVVLTFDHVIGDALVDRLADRMINVHPGLLPAFPGPRAIERAAASGVRFAGATMHVVTRAVDAGPVIAQCVVPTAEHEEAASLGAKIWPLLRSMYLQVLAWYAEGRVQRAGDGRVVVQGARYGALPISPAIERTFDPRPR